MSEDELRELEWSATFLRDNQKPQGCRCAGSCPRCREWAGYSAKVGAEAVLSLLAEVRRLRSEAHRIPGGAP